jgi:ketosteroid isomerase-like protein
VAAFAALLCASSAAAEAAYMAPIRAYIEAVNRGDARAASGAFASDAVIIDEVAPHVWSGPTALRDWSAAVDRDAAAYALTDAKVQLGPSRRALVEGDHAYVVLPEVFTYRQDGRAMRLSGLHTFSLRKGADGWKITVSAWASAGPPRRVVSKTPHMRAAEATQ